MPNRLLLAVFTGFALILGLDGHLLHPTAGPCGIPIPALVSVAMAQDVMKFEEVSPESAAALEKQRASARARTSERGRTADLRAAPDAPVPPVPPIPPVSRSGDVVRIGSDIHIEENQVVDGDVFALQGDIRVDGHVKGNVATTGGDITLGSTARVDRDVMCIGGELHEEPGAIVGGQRVTALRGREGDRRFRFRDKVRERIHERLDEGGSHGRGFAFAFSWMIVTVLVAWSLARFIPGRTGVALQTLRNEPGASLLVGLAIILLLIPSIVALALA